MRRLLLLAALLGFSLPSFAQMNDSLTVLWLSQPGVRPAQIFSDGFESGDTSALFDANGDKTPDLVLVQDDEQGNLRGILVLDAVVLDTLWRVQDLPQAIGIAERDGMKFHGFANPDGGATREAILSNKNDVLIVDPTTNSLKVPQGTFIPSDFPVLLRSIIDLTGDGLEELVLFLPETQQVRIVGKQD